MKPSLPSALCAAFVSFSAAPALACDIALILAMDVSGSVDAHEFELQSQGVAQALRDPAVRDALTHGQVSLGVVQWSGAMEQAFSIPWERLTTRAEVDALATRIARMQRAFAGSNTAVGEAIAFSAEQFSQVRDCDNWVIDVSGDGDENEGYTLPQERRAAYQSGIVINGLAIEAAGLARPITSFYNRWVVTPGAFVITAQQHDDFARAIREKLLRELVPPIASLRWPEGPQPQPATAFFPDSAVTLSFLHD